MSGSKKKMARKELEQTKPTQVDAAQAGVQSKVKTYWIVGIVSVVVVLALLIWNTGIFFKNSTAITIGDREFSIAEVDYYYNQMLSYESQMAMYGMSYFTSVDDVYDYATGQTYEEYFLESAVDALLYNHAVSTAATEAGYELSDQGYLDIADSQEYVDTASAQYGMTRANYLTQSYGAYMTESLFEEMLYEMVLAEEYAALHLEGLVYDDSEYEAYYEVYVEENFADLATYTYRAFAISGALSSDLTEEESAALAQEATEKAEAAVAMVEAASEEDKETVFQEALFAYIAEESVASYEENPDLSLQTGYTGTELDSMVSYSSWLKDDSRVYGDVTMIETSVGYSVVLYMDRAVSYDSTVNIRHILTSAELTQEDDVDTADVNESIIPTQEALDAAYAEAADLLDQWQSGDATAESFGELAELYSDDSGSNTNGGAYTYVTEGTMFDEFDAWINDSSRQAGDVTLIENPQSGQYGWHVVYFEDYAGAEWEPDAQSALQSGDQLAWQEALMALYTVVEESGMQYVGG